MPDSTPKPQGCEVCSKTDSLVRCSGCQVIYYCGREHFLADQALHKVHCAPVKKARKKYEVEEQKLRDAPPDIFLPERVFETCTGSFWESSRRARTCEPATTSPMACYFT